VWFLSYFQNQNEKNSLKEKELVQKIATLNVEFASKFEEYSVRESYISAQLKSEQQKAKLYEEQSAVS
jgi:hypothetical protein